VSLSQSRALCRYLDQESLGNLSVAFLVQSVYIASGIVQQTQGYYIAHSFFTRILQGLM
jgi:hypothetical protein